MSMTMNEKCAAAGVTRSQVDHARRYYGIEDFDDAIAVAKSKSDGLKARIAKLDAAAELGISRAVVHSRIARGWTPEKALTTPRPNAPVDEFAIKAKQNGIAITTYRARIRAGWDKAAAATTPVMTIDERRKYSKEIIALAGSNGIRKSTLEYRVRVMKMDLQQAATLPLKGAR